LAIAESTFKPPLNPRLGYEVEIRSRPSILDNLKYLQVFEDDEQIKRFLEMVGEFSNLEIDQEDESEELQEELSNRKFPLKDSIGNQKIVELKNNVIPKGLVPLERLFNANDVVVHEKKIDS